MQKISPNMRKWLYRMVGNSFKTLKAAALTYVRKFYVNADHIKGYKFKVRNVEIKYKANTINKHFLLFHLG